MKKTREIDNMERRRDELDFESLVRPHLKYLYRIAYRFAGNKADAEDLVQDMLVKLYPRREELANVASLRPWLVRVLYRMFVDSQRKKKRFPFTLVGNRSEADAGDPVEQVPGREPDPEEYARRRNFYEHLERALNGLSRDQRAVLTLHDIEGYALPELEGLLEVPLGTLKSRLHRAREKVRESLKKHGTLSPLSTSLGVKGLN